MAGRFAVAAVLAVMSVIAAACDRPVSNNAAITSTSPAGASTSPSPAAASHRNEALMRVIDAAPSSTNFDLYAGDLLFFDALGFKAITPYRAIDGKRYAFALRPAGMSQAKPLSSNTEDLKNGEFYTAFAMPGDGNTPNLRIVGDHLDQPASGKARLRVVHAGADAGHLQLRPSGSTDALFDDVDFQTVSGYKDVAPLNGAIEVRGTGDGAAALATVTAHLEAGRFYTLVIVGSARSTPRLEAFLIEDALTP